MQIQVKTKSFLPMVALPYLLDCINRRLLVHIRINVKTIEILTQNVHTIVPVIHSIRVEHRYQLENKVFSQVMSPCII